MDWYNNVIVPESPVKIRFQEKEAKEGVALGLEISSCQIQGNGVTIFPALEETHLGITRSTNPKRYLAGKVRSREKPATGWLALGFGKSVSLI